VNAQTLYCMTIYCLFFRLLLVCLVFAKILIPAMNAVKPATTNIIGSAINVGKPY
jgi:hypothetical protein